MSRTRIYLSGPVESYDTPNQWRDELVNEYEYYMFYHPLEEHTFELPLSESERYMMVMQQLRQVNLSDILLVRYIHDVETWGTPIEIFWAYTCGVPVVVWLADNDMEMRDLPNYLCVFADRIEGDIETALRWGENML